MRLGAAPFAALAAGGRRVLAVALAVLVLGTLATPAGGAEELTVSAAASLRAAFGEVAAAFAQASPGVTVHTNFGGSSTLVMQIREGAPVDLFASADEASMQKLLDASEIEGAPEVFATNRLAIVVARGNPMKVASVADLSRPGLTIALCGPAVPAGHYAREIFATAGVAVPESSQELDVKAVVTRVALGEADAGIVYATDVRAAGDAVEGLAIPDALNVTARYPVAVLARTKEPGSARAFVRFLRGSEGSAILARHGFLPP